MVTTREIAAAFDNGMEFFSTFGGNPVACAAGLAVLRRARARRACRRTRGGSASGCSRGAARRSRAGTLIGDVRGPACSSASSWCATATPLEPAADEAAYVVNRMRERGVLIGTDGPFGNVLKLRPPLVFSEDDAALFLAVLDEVLQEDGAGLKTPTGVQTGRPGAVTLGRFASLSWQGSANAAPRPSQVHVHALRSAGSRACPAQGGARMSRLTVRQVCRGRGGACRSPAVRSIGCGIGAYVDKGKPPKHKPVARGDIDTLKVGEAIEIQLWDGRRLSGKYQGLEWTRPEAYGRRYEAARKKLEPELQLPALGPGARVVVTEGGTATGDFRGIGPGLRALPRGRGSRSCRSRRIGS